MMRALREYLKRGTMDRKQWLMQLRKCSCVGTLEKIIEKKNYELDDISLAIFWGASDHRLAELTMGRLYDKVPREVWRFVR